MSKEPIQTNKAPEAIGAYSQAIKLGDLLFTIINLSRFMNVSSENALRKSNKKFINRFKLLEKKVKSLDKKVNDLSIDELNQIWEEVKKPN